MAIIAGTASHIDGGGHSGSATRDRRQTRYVVEADRQRAQAGWRAMRGRTLFRTAVDVVGAFPGAIASGQDIRRRFLTVTENYLVIDEGLRTGFAIDVDDVVELTIIPSPTGRTMALCLRYVSDESSGRIQSFAIRASGLFGTSRIRFLVRLFADAGIDVRNVDRDVRPRALALSWPDARRFSSELVIWSGEAVAPIGGWLARDRGRCKVWLTAHSFFWCEPRRDGVNRIPVADMVDVSADPGGEVPALAIALRDAEGNRQELLFGFDRLRNSITAEHACQTLVNALASRNVATVNPIACIAPWLIDADQPATIVTMVDSIVDLSLREQAEADDVAVSDIDGAEEPEMRIKQFEAGCLAEIACLNQQVINPDRDIAPDLVSTERPRMLSDALDAIALQISNGSINLADADASVRRLKSLAEGRSKLRAIRQQQINGLRAKAALLHERKAVMSSLGEILAP